MKEIILDDFSDDNPILKVWKYHLIASIRLLISYAALLVYFDMMWDLLNSKNESYLDLKLTIAAFFFMLFLIWLLFQIAVSLVEFRMRPESSLEDLNASPSSLNMLIVLLIIFGTSFFTIRFIENKYPDFSMIIPGIGVVTLLTIIWFFIKKEVHDFILD